VTPRHGARVLGTILTLVVATSTRADAQETTDYVITDYELTVDVQPGGNAARITMDLAYQIRSGTKSEGFKYIGNLEPTGVEGSETNGPPMRVSVERQRETLIRWRFTPAGQGIKRVRVSFTIRDALAGTLEENVFRAAWAGVFKVPVRRAAYRLILPEGWEEDAIITQPSGFARTTYNGRPAVEVEQRPLRQSAFVVTLRPGIAAAAPAPALPVASSPPTRSTPRESGAPLGLLFVVVVFVAVVVVVARAKRGRPWGKLDASSGSSSCAGGSSCSSSCGGGGCGGGCGG
jgi:uncharacterized membrane protein YgcG